MFLLSLGTLAFVIATTPSDNTTDCQSGPPAIDFTLPLWKIPFDFVDYEMLGRRYSENDCCENETAQNDDVPQDTDTDTDTDIDT